MKLEAYRDEIKLRMTGGVLELELDDATLDKIVQSALREVQRYLDTTKIITIPYSKCIDMSEYNPTSVARVYRTEGYMGDASGTDSTTPTDPMYASQWQLLSGAGNMYNFNNYAYNYAAWNTLLQIRNTMSTDMAFIYDEPSQKLYVNVLNGSPKSVTIEYVPRVISVEEITSDYWTDIIMRMSIALTKVTLGRIRSRYSQASGLFGMDGEAILSEGNDELNSLRDRLSSNSQLIYGVD